MGKAEENKKKKEEALFNTAFELFTTRGIHNTAISDIVNKAGVGKGTFYLYFKDKYDIMDKLIVKKTSILFGKAVADLEKEKIECFDEEVIYVIDHIIEALKKDKILLKLISKNLAWGVYKKALSVTRESDTQQSYYTYFMNLARSREIYFKNPDVTLFIIVEMVGATCYNAILNEQPVGIEALKPELYAAIRGVLRNGRKDSANA